MGLPLLAHIMQPCTTVIMPESDAKMFKLTSKLWSHTPTAIPSTADASIVKMIVLAACEQLKRNESAMAWVAEVRLGQTTRLGCICASEIEVDNIEGSSSAAV